MVEIKKAAGSDYEFGTLNVAERSKVTGSKAKIDKLF